MNWFNRLFRAGVCDPGLSRSPLPSPSRQLPPSLPERLESRTLFQTGPTLVGESLLGTAQAVTGVVLTFNEPLDPATAQNVNAYAIGRHVTSGSSSGGFLSGLFPFTDRPGQVDRPTEGGDIVLHPDRRGVHAGRVAFTSAVYDDSTMSVTLTPSYPIKATKFFRYVHVSGMGTTAVTNTDGQPIVGNSGGTGNIRVAFKPKQQKTVRYYDSVGSRVTLSLKGPGTIVAFLRTGLDPQPIVLLENTYAGQSILTGSVKPAAAGIPDTTSLQELEGVSNCDATAVTGSSEFTINSIEP